MTTYLYNKSGKAVLSIPSALTIQEAFVLCDKFRRMPNKYLFVKDANSMLCDIAETSGYSVAEYVVKLICCVLNNRGYAQRIRDYMMM